MEYEEKLERMKELRKKYPELNLIEKGGNLIDLIFAHGADDKMCESHFEDLEKILEKTNGNV